MVFGSVGLLIIKILLLFGLDDGYSFFFSPTSFLDLVLDVHLLLLSLAARR